MTIHVHIPVWALIAVVPVLFVIAFFTIGHPVLSWLDARLYDRRHNRGAQ